LMAFTDDEKRDGNGGDNGRGRLAVVDLGPGNRGCLGQKVAGR
jgi:hypothetical protein